MAIEYNYDGPPSLEIYQDFVRTSTTGADAQSVVVVAEHYDVVKKDYNPDKIEAKSYNMDEGLTFDWAKDLKTSESLVDKDSIKATISKVYAQKKLISGTYTKTNGNQIKVTNLDDVYVGDVVAIPVSTGKNKLAKIISIGSSGSTAAPKVSVFGEDTAEDAKKLIVVGNYTGKSDRRYYVKVTAVGTDTITTQVTTADGTDGANVCTIPVSADGSKSVALASSGLKVYVTSADVTEGIYFIVDATAGNVTRDLINLDTVVTAAADSAATDIPVGGQAEDGVIDIDYISVGSNITIPAGIVNSEKHIIMSGEVFIEYRSTSNKFYNKLGTVAVEDGAGIESIVGYTGVENPLGAMASVALKGGASLYCTSVNADTAAEYQRAFSFLSRSTDTYAVVIGSLRSDVIGNLSTFLNACADPKVANYKIGYYGLDSNTEATVFDGAMATLTGNEVTCAEGGFLTNNVHEGDIISMVVGRTDAGKPDYAQFEISAVVSDTVVEVTGADLITQPVPVAFSVKRTLKGGELVDELKSRVYTNNHRCYCVFGDGITVDGIEDAPTWLLAALPAGMRAAEYVQRPISNLAYDGCSADNKINLTASEMKELASRGVWILANDTTGSTVYNYHQLSTDMSDKKYQEQSYTTNFDNISRSVRSLLAPYYGNSNISQDLFNQILADITALLDLKVMRVPSIQVGPQLVSYSDLRLEQDAVNKDHVYMYVDYEMPAPFNHVVAKQRLI